MTDADPHPFEQRLLQHLFPAELFAHYASIEHFWTTTGAVEFYVYVEFVVELAAGEGQLAAHELLQHLFPTELVAQSESYEQVFAATWHV